MAACSSMHITEQVEEQHQQEAEQTGCIKAGVAGSYAAVLSKSLCTYHRGATSTGTSISLIAQCALARYGMQEIAAAQDRCTPMQPAMRQLSR